MIALLFWITSTLVLLKRMTQTLCALCGQPFQGEGPKLTGNPKLYHMWCAYESCTETRERANRNMPPSKLAPPELRPQPPIIRQPVSATKGQPIPATQGKGDTQWIATTSKPPAKDEPSPAGTKKSAPATPTAKPQP